MKKMYLLMVAGFFCLKAGAQQADLDAGESWKGRPDTGPVTARSDRKVTTAKLTATPFFSEDFSSGTPGSLPSGWTVTANGSGPAGWRWTKQAATGTYSIGTLNSTTAGNGWMIYNSDSLGSLFPRPLIAALTSPFFSCAGHSSVVVLYEQYFGQAGDSCFLDVSLDGTNWTAFPLKENNTLNAQGRELLKANPTLSRVDISSIAANQTNVKFRFRYELRAQYPGGGDNWLIDDVAVSELDSIDLAISGSSSAMYLPLGSSAYLGSYGLFYSIPVSLVDSVAPITYISNLGKKPVVSPTFNLSLFRGTTLAGSSTKSLSTLPYLGTDAVVYGDAVRASAIGNYTAAFNVSAVSDGYLKNNVDTQRFAVTDTTYSTHGNKIIRSYILRNGAVGVWHDYLIGCRFSIPPGKKDTLTSVSVSYDRTTVSGVNTVVQIYKFTSAASCDPVCRTQTKVLKASDISTVSSIVHTNYYCDLTGGNFQRFILESGDYVAVVRTVDAPDGSDVAVNMAEPFLYDPGQIPITKGYFSYSPGTNDPDPDVYDWPTNASQVLLLREYTPVIEVHFGHFSGVGLATFQKIYMGDAYPNPTNSILNLPIAIAETANVKVRLSDMFGRVIQINDLGRVSAGQQKVTQFNTVSLVDGVYLCTVEASGRRVSKRIIVAH